MASLAKIDLIGNIGGDPETRYTKAGQMNVTFSLAVNHKRRDQNGNDREIVNWYRVTCWSKLAETMDGFVQDGALAKGTRVYVSGRYVVDTYTDRDGNQRESHDVSANEVLLMSSREDASQSQGRGRSSMPQDRQPVAAGADVDDLPF